MDSGRPEQSGNVLQLHVPDHRLIAIGQERLHAVWPTILPGLAKIHRRASDHWIPEDVYAALRTGHSTLHLAEIDGQYLGFVVLTPSSVWDGLKLHIWCAYGEIDQDVVALFLPQLEQMARSIGARRITFWSSRRWDRRIKPYGFALAQAEYVKEL